MKGTRIEALKYRTEDNNDIIIVVDLVIGAGYVDNATIWRISEIKYKTARQRNYRYFSESFRDSYAYRKLDIQERDRYALSKYMEFVGKDKLEEALIAAHKSITPNLDNLYVSNI